MKGNWEEVPREKTPSWSAGPQVTLNRRGHIAFNRRAHELLGRPEAVVVFYDQTNRRIGLRAANPHLANAYPLIKAGLHGGRRLHANRVLAKQGIDVPETLEFPDARIDEDEILILDLRTARASRRAEARKAPATNADARVNGRSVEV